MTRVKVHATRTQTHKSSPLAKYRKGIAAAVSYAGGLVALALHVDASVIVPVEGAITTALVVWLRNELH